MDDTASIIIVIVAMVFIYKIIKMRCAYAHRRLELSQSPGATGAEDRLARLEQRMESLETLIVEEEKRRSSEEKWKTLER